MIIRCRYRTYFFVIKMVKKDILGKYKKNNHVSGTATIIIRYRKNKNLIVTVTIVITIIFTRKNVR